VKKHSVGNLFVSRDLVSVRAGLALSARTPCFRGDFGSAHIEDEK
jgi:hypothetical protein